MTEPLFQWNYIIEGLLPPGISLQQKVQLSDENILLTTREGKLKAYVLGVDDLDRGKQQLSRYLQFAALISLNRVTYSGGSGASILSKSELGTKPELDITFRPVIPDEAIKAIQPHVIKYLSEISRIHDLYQIAITENKFLRLSLDFFYESQISSAYSDEGLIKSIISMEALFNDGSTDISYKLALRAAFILSPIFSDTLTVFNNLKKAYSCRSKIVHGSGADINVDGELQSNICHYNRSALMIFMILLNNPTRQRWPKNKRKDCLMQQIDHAMIDLEKRNLMIQEITHNIPNFNIEVPRSFEGEAHNKPWRFSPW